MAWEPPGRFGSSVWRSPQRQKGDMLPGHSATLKRKSDHPLDHLSIEKSQIVRGSRNILAGTIHATYLHFKIAGLSSTGRTKEANDAFATLASCVFVDFVAEDMQLR